MERTINNSKVLVTGGAGFIGSNLCEALLEQNNEVVCLDNFMTGHRHNIEPFLSKPNFTLIEGDIRNYEDCQKAVVGVDYVLHQAALGSVPRSIVDPMTATDVNIGGFVKILFAAKEAGVKRFVYAASSSTYGDSKVLPKVEHKIGVALSPYAITKYVDELYAKNFSDLYGIETIGLRYFNVFGRRQDPNGAYAAVIPLFVKKLMDHESPVINGDGTFSRDFTYIDNVIQANQLAAITPTDLIRDKAQLYYQKHSVDSRTDETLSEVFNVAFGERTDIQELIDVLKRNLSTFDSDIANVEIIHGPTRAGDIPHSLASIEKGRTLLGYDPKFSIKEGIQEATEWYWKNLS
ncbi:NAD-dependent epimerase/dehydratase family protein [Marinifilum sp. N1E240]|uniref:SDR family oxidoreductase n=1 Tax=Marinifilum sp. N1E240 TaxID=2608082 RepID=UPI00128BF9C1|nr:SDR family oxidoreductase [Marinifilum sp. N1E240]MPQ46448.1 NAD-dependent epimerase/dehydratase family protein [Marinifilum sp. N1E240]